MVRVEKKFIFYRTLAVLCHSLFILVFKYSLSSPLKSKVKSVIVHSDSTQPQQSNNNNRNAIYVYLNIN